MKQGNKFKIGDRVIHRAHGKGTIVADTGDPSSALVKFDKEVESWGTDILEVSIGCLEIDKENAKMTIIHHEDEALCNICEKELETGNFPIFGELHFNGSKGSTYIEGEWCSLECLVKDLEKHGVIRREDK